jgi:hypothetical protein
MCGIKKANKKEKNQEQQEEESRARCSICCLGQNTIP